MSEPQLRASGSAAGPVTGKTVTLAVGAGSQDHDIAAGAAAAALAGGLLGFVSGVATQIAFGDSAVTIAASDPAIPANTIVYFVPTGSHLGYKAGGAGTAYIWYAGRVGP